MTSETQKELARMDTPGDANDSRTATADAANSSEPRDDGGAAFPVLTKLETTTYGEGADYHAACEGGMTLRDYFAAKAMQAMAVGPCRDVYSASRLIAMTAYSLADAMLKERAK